MSLTIIKDFNDYMVSDDGEVISMKYGKNRILKKALIGQDNRNYYSVNLYKDGKRYKRTIHQLVWDCFGDEERLDLVVDHKDNNRFNNNINNLQLLSNRENCSKDRKNKTSKYTGVYWRKDMNCWTSQIYIDGKIINLGGYINEYDAHISYKKELEKLCL